MLAFALSGIYAIADGFFVGNALGDDALAAVNIAFPLTAFLQAVGTGIGMGGAIEYAIHAGSKHESLGKQYMGMSIVLLGGCSILFTILFLLAGPQILGVFGASGEILEYSSEYLRFVSYGAVFQIAGTGLVPSGDDLFGMPCIFYRKEARPILSFRWRRALSFVPYLRRGTFPFRVDLFAQYHVDPAE